MKFRTGFIANSFSSSFVLEICIELANGDNVSFRGRGSCGEGALSDFGELTMTVSPRELGHAASVKALVDMLRDGVVDSGFMNKKLRIMDEQDSERIKEANIARAKNHPVAASYDSAISFIRRVETIPDMDAINKIRVTGNEYNTKQYLRTYEYNRVTDSYTRKITGAEFEKNGGSGGDLIFTDGALAVDPRTVGSFRFTENLHFLNFKNREFVTTGFTNAENRQIEKEITARGGRMGQSVGDQCYCLIVNENYGRATEKYDRAVKYNSGKDLPFRLFSYYKTQKDAEDNGPVIFIISGGMFQGFLARPDGNSEAPSFPPYYRHGHRLIDVSAQVEELDLSGSEIQCAEPDAFKSCEQLRRLTLPTDELETGCFSQTPLEELCFTVPAKRFCVKWFGDRELPKISVPLSPIAEYQNPEGKKQLILSYLEAWEQGKQVDAGLKNDYDQYLRSYKKNWSGHDLALRYMAENGLLTAKEAQTFAKTAKDAGKNDLASLLEKCVAATPVAEKKAKSPTAAEEKLWSTKKLQDGTLMLRLYKGLAIDITIPAQLKGLPVTEVGSDAFSADAKELSEEQKEARHHIRSIIVPNGIKRLGSRMLRDCSELEQIVFPDGLEWSCGLYGVHSDVKVVCPNSYYSAAYAFSDAPFSSVTIPDGVEHIGFYAFANCNNLKTIRLPDSLLTIADDAFYSSSELESIELPDSVTAIGKDVFSRCANLKTVHLSVSLKEIPFGAFRWCVSLESIDIPDSVTVIHGGIGVDYPGAFCCCQKLKTVILHEGLLEIENTVFDSCKALSSIVIPDSVVSIAKNAFLCCNILICAHTGTFAEQYAKEYGLRFREIQRSENKKEADEKPTSVCGQSDNHTIQPGKEQQDSAYHAESYEDYICFLKNAVIMNRGHMLSDAEAEQFLSEYHLDSDWGITLEDVRNDMEKIVKKQTNR